LASILLKSTSCLYYPHIGASHINKDPSIYHSRGPPRVTHAKLNIPTNSQSLDLVHNLRNSRNSRQGPIYLPRWSALLNHSLQILYHVSHIQIDSFRIITMHSESEVSMRFENERDNDSFRSCDLVASQHSCWWRR